MRKIYVTMTVNLIINADEGIEAQTVLESLNMVTDETGADIEDVTIENYEVIDSK